MAAASSAILLSTEGVRRAVGRLPSAKSSSTISLRMCRLLLSCVCLFFSASTCSARCLSSSSTTSAFDTRKERAAASTPSSADDRTTGTRAGTPAETRAPALSRLRLGNLRQRRRPRPSSCLLALSGAVRPLDHLLLQQ